MHYLEIQLSAGHWLRDERRFTSREEAARAGREDVEALTAQAEANKDIDLSPAYRITEG